MGKFWGRDGKKERERGEMGRCGYLWTVGVRKSDKRQRDGGTERQRQGERAWKKCFELFDASRKERKRCERVKG